MATRALIPLLFLTLIAISESKSSSSLPQAAPDSLTIGYIQEVGNCTYKATITTSCLSPFQTSSEIGILFGDSHGNQIYEPKLEVESTSTFGNCSKDIFNFEGPCTDQICYLYIYKNGSDDWIPETVEISGSDIETVEFTYNASIPSNTWYGFDDCQYFAPPPPSPPPPPPPPPSAAGRLLTQKGLGFVILVLLRIAFF